MRFGKLSHLQQWAAERALVRAIDAIAARLAPRRLVETRERQRQAANGQLLLVACFERDGAALYVRLEAGRGLCARAFAARDGGLDALRPRLFLDDAVWRFFGAGGGFDSPALALRMREIEVDLFAAADEWADRLAALEIERRFAGASKGLRE